MKAGFHSGGHEVCQSGSGENNLARRVQMSHTTVGVDLAKRVFQLHWVEPETGEVISIQIKRGGFLEHFANRAPCLIGMEACGGAQHWARRLIEMGHQVRLMPGKAVKAAGSKLKRNTKAYKVL
jgi:transposase